MGLKNTMATKAWLQHFKGQIIRTGLVSDARLMAEASREVPFDRSESINFPLSAFGQVRWLNPIPVGNYVVFREMYSDVDPLVSVHLYIYIYTHPRLQHFKATLLFRSRKSASTMLAMEAVDVS